MSTKGTNLSVTSDYDVMRKFLLSADVLIGHNIQRFDIPALERLLGIKIKAKIVDTLPVCWYLYPSRHKNGLEDWGEEFGIKKPEINDWVNLSVEEYQHRCKEDVKINYQLWKKQLNDLIAIYGKKDGVWKLLDYLSFKMYCARLQEQSQWKLDVKLCEESLSELEEIQTEKLEALKKAMPQVPSITIKTKPKRFLNKHGEYTKLGMDWIALLTEKNLPLDYDGEVEIIKGYEEGNPNSPEQLKNWLKSIGWIPRTFKEVKNKEDGSIKSIPQINLEHGKGICDSIKELYDKEPALELLDGLSVIQHRMGILKGFLRDQENGYLKAQVAGLTNTLRFKHTTIVNLPKVDKLYAKSIRQVLIAEDGFELCGSDLSSLEDRLKQHFIFPHDPDFVREMMEDDYDPHLSLAVSASAITITQMQKYKTGEDKSIKPIRDIFKNGNYCLQYSAGIPKLAKTAGIDLDTAKKVYEAYWKKNWAIKKVASLQLTKTIDGQMWLFNPISELWYSLRYEKDVFSTLVQSSGSYIFDMWLKKVLDKRPQCSFQFHDEFGLLVKKGYRDQCERLIRNALEELNSELKLNRELDCDVQFGRAYSEIH